VSGRHSGPEGGLVLLGCGIAAMVHAAFIFLNEY
jgi:hypothetical protein